MLNETTTAFAIWLTGLPASGKSTLAQRLSSRLNAQGIRVQILDSDEIRQVLTPQPSYTPQERDWFYATITYIAGLLVNNNVPVIIAATANRRTYRDHARRQLPHFFEIYVDCSLEVCRSRDTKGTYRKAESGESATVPGVGSVYEEPSAPELVIDTSVNSPTQGSEQIIQLLKQQHIIPT